jgi:hypothetical protein
MVRTDTKIRRSDSRKYASPEQFLSKSNRNRIAYLLIIGSHHRNREYESASGISRLIIIGAATVRGAGAAAQQRPRLACHALLRHRAQVFATLFRGSFRFG